jgi:hypothetical protein
MLICLLKFINTVFFFLHTFYRKLQNDLYKLGNTVDGIGSWREKESQKLTDLVQRRLYYLQVG